MADVWNHLKIQKLYKIRFSKQKLFTQEKTEIFRPKMDVLIFRFPHLAGEIFDYLDDKNLAI